MKGSHEGRERKLKRERETLVFDVILNERGRGVYIVLGYLGRRPRSSPKRQEISLHTLEMEKERKHIWKDYIPTFWLFLEHKGKPMAAWEAQKRRRKSVGEAAMAGASCSPEERPEKKEKKEKRRRKHGGNLHAPMCRGGREEENGGGTRPNGGRRKPETSPEKRTGREKR